MRNIEAGMARREWRLDSQAATIDTDRVVPLSEGMIEADHDFLVRAVNFAAADLLGWDHPASLARDLKLEHWSLLAPGLQREVQLALAMRGRWEGQAPLRRRDGTLLDTYLTACILHGSPGVPNGIVATFRPLHAMPEPHGRATQGDLIGVKGLPGHFCLYYQPEVDLLTGEVTGAEALLRWWHPGLGVVSPGPALANRRWAPRLTEVEVWSIFAVCRQIAAWEAARRPLRVAVNLSRNHLADPELVGRIRRALAASGIDPGLLAVDLPAPALMQDPERVRQVARELVEVGVVVCIDEVSRVVPAAAFHDLPASVVKVARTPRRGTEPAAIKPDAASVVIDLCRRIGAISVAKTVETDEEVTMLRGLGCDRAFGHLFLPPVPPEELARTLWADAELAPSA